MWTGTPSKNRDYEKGLGRYLGHCIAGVLGNMYTGMGIGNYSEYNRNV
jgi:hypothetical protein